MIADPDFAIRTETDTIRWSMKPAKTRGHLPREHNILRQTRRIFASSLFEKQRVINRCRSGWVFVPSAEPAHVSPGWRSTHEGIKVWWYAACGQLRACGPGWMSRPSVLERGILPKGCGRQFSPSRDSPLALPPCLGISVPLWFVGTYAYLPQAFI